MTRVRINTEEYAYWLEKMNVLVADPVIVTVFSDLDGLDLSEFAEYFFSRMTNYFDKSYECSNDDILRSYIKTVGLSHSTINICTGGQRKEKVD